jgi:hypothetical protein
MYEAVINMHGTGWVCLSEHATSLTDVTGHQRQRRSMWQVLLKLTSISTWVNRWGHAWIHSVPWHSVHCRQHSVHNRGYEDRVFLHHNAWRLNLQSIHFLTSRVMTNSPYLQMRTSRMDYPPHPRVWQSRRLQILSWLSIFKDTFTTKE